MEPKLVIRQASAVDVSGIAQLRWEMKQEELGGEFEPDRDLATFTRECGLWLNRNMFEDPVWVAWIAVVNGVIVGNVFLRQIEKVPSPFESSTEIGYVTTFYVKKEFRGRGIGRSLLEEVVSFARKSLMDTLIVWPSERSVPLYRRCGFNLPEELLELPINPS
jgi:GNAT superfamily N-acetyltransferase